MKLPRCFYPVCAGIALLIFLLSYVDVHAQPGKVREKTDSTLTVFFGNLHAHTSYTDGKKKPADAFRYARDSARLDFMAVTDHQIWLTTAEYQDIRRQADIFTEPGAFVGIAGQEWTSALAHCNVFDADHVLTAPTGSLDSLYTELERGGYTANLNHPRQGTLRNYAYSDVGDKGINSVEVRNDIEQAMYITMLRKGWHVGADGSQDNHRPNWGDGPCWTALLARELTREAVLDAMRNHRTYSTYDRNIELRFKAEEHWMGESFDHRGTISFSIEIVDPDSGDVVSDIILYQNGVPVQWTSPGTSTHSWTPEITPPAGGNFYFITVDQSDGDRIWSSPVWIRSTVALPSTPVLSSPPDGALLSELTPRLSWNPSERTETYTLQYSTKPAFPAGSATVTVDGITDTSFVLPVALDDSAWYYWRVRSVNGDGESVYSGTRSFFTDEKALFSSASERRLTFQKNEDIRPTIFASTKRGLWLAWCSARDGNWEIYCKRSTDGGTTWSSPWRLTNQLQHDLDPTIAEDEKGNIVVAWSSRYNKAYEIFSKVFDGMSWSAEENLTRSKSNDMNPYLARGPEDRMMLAWCSDRAGGGYEIFLSIHHDTGWTPPVRMTRHYLNDYYPALITLPGNKVMLAWQRGNPDKSATIWSRFYDGGTWTEEEPLIDGASSRRLNYVAGFGDADGTLWLTYTEFNKKVLLRRRDKGVWSREVPLPETGGVNQYSRLTKTADGWIWIAYYSTRDGNTDIYAQRSRYPVLTGVSRPVDRAPTGVLLGGSFPNPARPTTRIGFHLPRDGKIRLEVYDLLGRIVRVLASGIERRGSHVVTWDGRDDNGVPVEPGVYFYRLSMGKQVLVRKMIVTSR